jgi:hypothetical protein
MYRIVIISNLDTAIMCYEYFMQLANKNYNYIISRITRALIEFLELLVKYELKRKL